ncbi:BTAD domain-containing putative transcriptional regulator [Paractinoplanes atraurantiacus]|uniref:DNA-binding transcriptional activator of the SARP family n=1 Tax=Paractinoplanes atraurantiacus TaxID=1036182 RepID=A0A285GQY3_9ACTN|nr:BTAD domain-containing putative transcriptional regulator [Actinoplanes atraurantiacus]SNY25875.1 DNA-binding transcriptional activator of the SARP family [Actinoplanes atraurantiacus]
MSGSTLRRLRGRAGLTQDELAQRSGISVRAVRDIESGRVRQPRPSSLDRLASVLGLSELERRQLDAIVVERGLRIGVLGPITASRLGIAVPPGPQAQRTLLGLLALRRNAFVAQDEVVDVLWGGRPPKSCLSQVQAMAGRLRRITEPDADLRRLPGGYRLEIDDDAVDAGRFARLSARARAIGAGHEAVELWSEALAGWRGPVVADAHERLRHHPATTELARARVSAVLAYADGAARAGRPETAIRQLQETAVAELHHEGLHARLILALAAAGDRAGALRQFEAIRGRLAEDFGLEPGEQLLRARRFVLVMHQRSVA